MFTKQNSYIRIDRSLVTGLSLMLTLGTAHAAQPHSDAPGNPMRNYAESQDAKQTASGIEVAELKRRRDVVRKHLARQRAKLDIVATTVTDSGQVIDWITPGSQVASGKLASPPPAPTDDEGIDGESVENISSISELAQQSHARGPEGTVPVVRRDVDEVINNIIPLGNVEDFLSKYGKAGQVTDLEAVSVPGDTSHEYASTRQYVDNLGSSGYVNVWNPYVYSAKTENNLGEFSLGQVALANTAAGEDKETIEAGWQDYPGFYGDNYPHLFIYYTTTGHESSGDNIGGYNRDVKGWVQYSRTNFPGMRLTNTSTKGGNQEEMRIVVKNYFGNWWIYADGEWLGYYPGSLFDSDRMASHATSISWYGEVVDVDDGQATFTDMGSGAHASLGYRNAAYMRNLTYYAMGRGWAVDYNADWTNESDSRCYSIATYFLSGGPWRSFFYWGGPGRTSLYSTYCGSFNYRKR